MFRPYEASTPEQMASWDAAMRRAEELGEREDDRAAIAAELREIAREMTERLRPVTGACRILDALVGRIESLAARLDGGTDYTSGAGRSAEHRKEHDVKTYTIQQHRPSGETYLLRYDDDAIAAVCGPLAVEDWSDDGGYTVKPGFDPSNGDFDPEDAEWANAQAWGAPRLTVER